jgi:hypothetical protein
MKGKTLGRNQGTETAFIWSNWRKLGNLTVTAVEVPARIGISASRIQSRRITDTLTVSAERMRKEVALVCGLVVKVSGYRSRDPGFGSRRYKIFWEVVGLKRVPLSLVNITEEILEWKNSGTESRQSRLTDPLSWPRDTLYPQKLILTSPTSGGLSVGIVRLRTKTTEFSF